MQAAARVKPQPHLSVSADKRSRYDALAHVLGIAQRNGMQQIGIRELR
jgi:biopolymer transport protein ExbD